MQAFLDDPELLGEIIDARICNDIASKLYQLRKAKGITQDHLAELLGVKQSNISRWESPGYQGYKVKVLSKIVRTLDGRLSVKIEPLTTYSYDLKFNSLTHLDEDSITIDMSGHADTLTSDKKGYKLV